MTDLGLFQQVEDEETKCAIEKERKRVYDALLELTNNIRMLEDELKPMQVEAIRLRAEFQKYDRMLAKITKVEVNVSQRDYTGGKKKDPAKEAASLVAKMNKDQLNDLLKQLGGGANA